MPDAPATVGRIVHFVMPDRQVRPAIVVRTWGADIGSAIQLQVFTDGSNDDVNLYESERSTPPLNDVHGKNAERIVWRTSVLFDGSDAPSPGTWHWPPRAPGVPAYPGSGSTG